MPTYQHEFIVDAPLSQVREFHRHSASMGAITPPPVIVQIHSAPEVLNEGDAMDFTMWLGPLPIRWLARIEDVSATGFVDRQIKGPFRRWDHTHTFEAVDDGQTKVYDTVEIEYSANSFWQLVGRGMKLNLPVLFAFRQWKTRRLLQRQSAGQQQAV
jgi:ligand-binding SRPBCC domain-containing protein